MLVKLPLQGALVMLTMSKELRVRRLVDDYCNDPNLSKVEQLEQLKNSTIAAGGRWWKMVDVA